MPEGFARGLNVRRPCLDSTTDNYIWEWNFLRWSLGYYANKYNSQLVEYNYYLYAGFPKGRDSEHSANSYRVYLSSEVVTIITSYALL